MKFAICNESLGDLPLSEGFRLAAEIGYTGIELAPFTLGDPGAPGGHELGDVRELSASQRADVRRAAEDAGLEVLGLHWLLAKTEGFHLTSPDTAVREQTQQYLIALAELCAELGGWVLVLGSPQNRSLQPGVTLEQATDYAVEVLKGVTQVCESSGVTLALEPLGPQETDFLNTAQQGVEMMERIGSPACKLHLDVKAMATEPTSIEQVIRDHAENCAHFHANDPNLLGPGMGEVDFNSIMATLRDVGYDAWVSVETFRFEPDHETVARTSYANLVASLGG